MATLTVTDCRDEEVFFCGVTNASGQDRIGLHDTAGRKRVDGLKRLLDLMREVD